MEVKVEGVSYNADSFLQQISEGLTLDQFTEQGLREGKYKEFSDLDRMALLKIAYDEIKRSGSPPLLT
jgi:hypothetical protein